MPRRKKQRRGRKKKTIKHDSLIREVNLCDADIVNKCLEIIANCNTNEAKKLLEEQIEDSYRDDIEQMQLLIAIIETVVDPRKNMIMRARFEDVPRDADGLLDITILGDDDFWKYFHMTRKTIKFVLKDVKSLPQELDICTNEAVRRLPIEIVVYICLIYLRCFKKDYTHIMTTFGLGSLEILEAILERGFYMICLLKTHSGLLWPPLNQEVIETSRVIYERYKFENVVGLLSQQTFITEKREKMQLQFVVNERSMIKAAELNYNVTIRGALYQATTIMEEINHLDDKYICFGGPYYVSEYGTQNLYHRLITPFPIKEDEELDSDEQMFNFAHKLTMKLAVKCLCEMGRRFPRLFKLHRAIPEAIIAACVLHNYCMMYHDEAPIY
uniref:Unkown protein n=1 Tax=Riptortus pedestris TaxID=329032 RepID=R4WKH8_RIPPE|nr:unkown protein [Riptortus pedestris]